MRRLIVPCVAMIATIAAGAAAQERDSEPSVSFEAASVRPNNSGESNTSVGPRPGGRFTATNAPVGLLIMMAYGVQQFQVQGAPAWTRTDRFDIVAKLDGDPPPVPFGSTQPNPMMLALRTLLAERFKLVTHWDTQDMPIYQLVLARADGKLGPNIGPAATDCATVMAAQSEAARAGRTINPNTSDRVACGMRNTGSRMQFGGSPLSVFAAGLSNEVARIVVDRTGLTGNWDFEFTYTRERVRAQALAGNAPPDVDPNGPSLFTAIQEQLGLKLESTKGPVQVLVIDRVERPTPD